MPEHDRTDPHHAPRGVFAILMAPFGAVAIAAGISIAVTAGGTARAAEPAGKADYERYCADCHGNDATGNGPLVKQIPMSPPPSNLTLLARGHGGKFPFAEVVDDIDGRKAIPSHQRIQMPFWGVTLQTPNHEFTPSSDAEVKRRIEAMARYVESLQR